MNKFNYSIAAIAAGLSLLLSLGGAANAEKNVCDMKILKRPGCEVGDFGVYFGEGPHEVQGIDERPMIRDFREAPTAPQMIQLPPPPNGFGGGSTPGIRDADDDESAEMRAAWNEWHKRVASYVFQRFSTLANAAFPHSRPMAAVAAYTVTRDGRVLNARLTQVNMNPIYNAIILTAINSMNGNLQILRFPQGSHRMMVDKAGTFIHNSGSGRIGDPNPPVGDFGPDHPDGEFSKHREGEK
jgi:hypothetical protein